MDDEGEEEGCKEGREEAGQEEEEVTTRASFEHGNDAAPTMVHMMVHMTRAMGLVIGMLLVGVSAAHAASITNREERDHTVTIIEGEAKADHVLKPSRSLSGVCLKGCIIRVNDGENIEYRLSGGDAVSIEDGSVYYDMPDASMRPASPPGPGKRPPRNR